MMPREEFGDRMESLITEVKAVQTAPGVEEIFFPASWRTATAHATVAASPWLTRRGTA